MLWQEQLTAGAESDRAQAVPRPQRAAIQEVAGDFTVMVIITRCDRGPVAVRRRTSRSLFARQGISESTTRLPFPLAAADASHTAALRVQPLTQRGVAAFCPFGAEFGEGFRFQDAFGEREDDAFFFVEMFPGRGDRAEQ